MAKSQKIIMKNFKMYEEDPVDGTSICMTDNVFIWDLTIFGPKDSIYEGGVFKGTLSFPDNFPHNPPKLVFKTKIYHPNIYDTGEVCISILHPPGEVACHHTSLFASISFHRPSILRAQKQKKF